MSDADSPTVEDEIDQDRDEDQGIEVPVEFSPDGRPIRWARAESEIAGIHWSRDPRIWKTGLP